MCTTRPSLRQRGLTLIELVVFIVIVSVALVGILSVLDLTVSHSADPVLRKQSLAIAESLMEEIQAMYFDDTVATQYSGSACYAATGAHSQANRANFKCIDDYIGFPTTPTTGIYSVTDFSTALPGLSAYKASVAITTTTFSWNDGVARTSASGSVKIITITVTDPTNTSYTLTGYRFNYG